MLVFIDIYVVGKRYLKGSLFLNPSLRGSVIYYWWRGLNKLFFSHLKISWILNIYILTLSIYWHVSSLYWDIDHLHVRDTDTCHTVSHNVTWQPCQISWQSCHFIINFIYKSKYLIAKENIQSQWLLKSSDLFSLFLPN